ncbi:MAG: cupin domain-containing protein [Steroidobacter sp.]
MHANNMLLNADRLRHVVMHGAKLPWLQSSEYGVERCMLERAGGEIALATSIVRYQPGSKFSSHIHDLGEEFLVLEGTFADEHGEYSAGTYVRNTPGSSHAPYSTHGCTIFVKLRQMARNDTGRVKLLPDQQVWQSSGNEIEQALLYANDSIVVGLLRMKSGCELPARRCHDGEELFVIQGSVLWCDARRTVLNKWSWLRNPGSEHRALISQDDSLLWIKRGHLNPVESNG